MNHPFTEGNRRVGSLLFLLLRRDRNPRAFSALTLLVAESARPNNAPDLPDRQPRRGTGAMTASPKPCFAAGTAPSAANSAFPSVGRLPASP